MLVDIAKLMITMLPIFRFLINLYEAIKEEGIHMPNIKSAKKRMVTSEKSRVRNQAEKSKIKHTRRSFMEAVEGKGKEVSAAELKAYCSVLDKAAKKGIIEKNTAIRRKRRATEKVRAIA